MHKIVLILLGLAFSLQATAHATEYVFGCKNSWMQLVDVHVTAESENEARKLLKTDPQYNNDYSLCSFKRSVASKRPNPLEAKPQPQSFSE